jgi:hypothetical protein
MTTEIDLEEFSVYIHPNECFIIIESRKGSQGILSFELSDNRYMLYKWYNEGNFPNCVDTICDNHNRYRLSIVGVDDI